MRAAVTMVVLLLVSCASAISPPLSNPHALQLTIDDVQPWRYRQAIGADLDGDGSRETVILTADVQYSDRGVPLWEDGHRWALVVEDEAQRTLVYSAFVPNGFAEAAVLEPSPGGRREVLIQERTPHHLRTLTIRYDGPGRAAATSMVHHEIQSWSPGSARLPL